LSISKLRKSVLENVAVSDHAPVAHKEKH